MTPHELNLQIMAFNERQRAEMDERMTLFYLNAGWSRSTKPMPSLKKLLSKQPNKKRQQSPEEMLAIVKNLNAAFGGTRRCENGSS
ncbi:hypothetical protein PA598K_01494 [Paenibacillus sp. 598K]|uniref:hypothetical protein n=1 Tax=Paenibacillus sp. 598K TaxID=1117987 RepID=UPI000FFAEDA2|nr:hypothetical protein [Paenibacillus sp. 598K]GBF73209.1 hypothetical protein PA598K_01494 [Paenibacillus sp. 598K]